MQSPLPQGAVVSIDASCRASPSKRDTRRLSCLCQLFFYCLCNARRIVSEDQIVGSSVCTTFGHLSHLAPSAESFIFTWWIIPAAKLSRLSTCSPVHSPPLPSPPPPIDGQGMRELGVFLTAAWMAGIIGHVPGRQGETLNFPHRAKAPIVLFGGVSRQEVDS